MTKPKKELIQIRVTEEEKAELRDRATEAGFSNVSEYLRVAGKKRHRQRLIKALQLEPFLWSNFINIVVHNVNRDNVYQPITKWR